MMIVIGGSLGGTRALDIVLRLLPQDFPHPIAVALHRSRDSSAEEGGVTEFLQRASLLPVSEPLDKELILGGHIYLAPADYHLMVERAGFCLSTDEPVQFARPSIDVLFESAADAFGREAVAVVLTGASQDGAHGAACIRDRGGLVIVQDPATAEARAMPQAAIDATGTSHIHALREIGRFLAQLAAPAPLP
jgi:two-component system chemotaxis response regulator CheB